MKYLISASLLLALLSWGLGAGNCGYGTLAALLTGHAAENQALILLAIRLPRILGAFLAGAMLAAAGAASQNLFRNALASPHVLGVIHAASLGAVLGLFAGRGAVLPGALLFSAGTLLLLFFIGKRKNWNGTILILAGIAVNTFCAALTSGILFLADERLSGLVFWLLGGFGCMSWERVPVLLLAAGTGFGLLVPLRREMDMLLLGDRAAELAGVSVGKVKFQAMAAIAVLTAGAVSCCGVIGFLGLAVPHIVRSFSGTSFRRLLPFSIVCGGMLLLAADIPARMLFSPYELPVGILTSLGGGVFFFALLIRQKEGNCDHA